MRVKANVSFAGIVTMGAGEEKDIPDGRVVKDLLRAGYVEKINDTTKTVGGSKKDSINENK